MTIYTATFRAGGKKYQLIAQSPQGARGLLARARTMFGEVTDVKWFGDTTEAYRGHRPQIIHVDEAGSIPDTFWQKLIQQQKDKSHV